MALKESEGVLKDSKLEEFSNNSITKSLSMKNRRAAGNWKQLVQAIDIQKHGRSAELNQSRNKLLHKRDEIRTRTVSLSSKPSDSRPEKPALLKVYDKLMASMEANEKRLKSSNVNASVTKPTQSSERKKVVRKNVSLSLGELQKEGSKLDLKNKWKKRSLVQFGDKSQNREGDTCRIQRTRPRSAFDYTEEELEISRKLYCSPRALPRIYQQESHRPRFRSFGKDDAEYRKRISVDEDSWKDIHHCRYLRLQGRSHTVHDLRTTSDSLKCAL